LNTVNGEANLRGGVLRIVTITKSWLAHIFDCLRCEQSCPKENYVNSISISVFLLPKHRIILRATRTTRYFSIWNEAKSKKVTETLETLKKRKCKENRIFNSSSTGLEAI